MTTSREANRFAILIADGAERLDLVEQFAKAGASAS